MANNVIGKSPYKIDGREKVLGKATFPQDLIKENALCGGLKRIPVSCAKILRVDVSEAKKVPGVEAVLTADDVPGLNAQGVLYTDMPVLSKEMVRSVNDVVALVAAGDKDALEEALYKIKVEYQEVPGVFDPEEAMKPDAPLVHPDMDSNIVYHLKIRKGDVEAAFEKSAVIVEDTYRTPTVDHAFLQPEAALSYMDERGHVVVHIATQYPHWDRAEIARSLNIPLHKVRVITTNVGGAFGGREDMTLQVRAALLALKTGKPVRIVLEREESFHLHSKRHAITMHYKTGADKDGKLTAVEAKIIGDTGAYASWAPNVLRKSAVHATGPYRVPNVKIDSYAVYTNNPFAGAMRGFGAAQPPIAYEMQMDLLANKLGMDPVTIRSINCFEVGDETATGQILDASVGLKECLEKACEKAGWREKGGGING